LIKVEDLNRLYKTLQGIESLFGWPPDIEWTGREEHFTLLQARPITTDGQQSDDKAYYLDLRPGESKLKSLAKKVVEDLIPQLESEGEHLANQNLSSLRDQELVEAIEYRQEALEKWKKIYWDDFIPFAHGVRYLGTYYNDAVQPADPYEFVGLLKGQQMISTQRNDKLISLAHLLKADQEFRQHLQTLCNDDDFDQKEWQLLMKQAPAFSRGEEFIQGFNHLLTTYMDVSYGEKRVKNQPLPMLKLIIELSNFETSMQINDQSRVNDLESKLFAAVGSKKHAKAEEVLHIGRLSWRLRDDDNLLLGRVESQLIRALEESGNRLKRSGRLEENAVILGKSAETILSALRDETKGKITLSESDVKPTASLPKDTHTRPRQLTGQPASPGMVSGKVRVIRKASDIGDFKSGEILVCDAIQPNMTHLVPLARAIIERRGGMLIHGAIIAREMNIPCVNGVSNAADLLENGDLVTVDGDLGIVTVGVAEFDLELGL
jgi:pyruvate,water dikinase